MYKWALVKKLKPQGLGIKSIARKIKLSKNTVNKYLKYSLPSVFNKPERQNGLEEFRTEIENMHQNKFIGTRIYEEVKKLGYQGSLSSVHRFLKSMNKTKEIDSKRTSRFETKRGEQMQYDWSQWLLPIGNKKIKVYVHGIVDARVYRSMSSIRTPMDTLWVKSINFHIVISAQADINIYFSVCIEKACLFHQKNMPFMQKIKFLMQD